MTDKEYRVMQLRQLLSERGSVVHEWLREKGREYKEFGTYPLSLTDYYAEPRDMEVAAVLELLVPEPLDGKSTKRQSNITELHNLLGEHPSRMISERGFMHLAPKDETDGILGRMSGVHRGDLFNLLDWIWEVRDKRQIPLEMAVKVLGGLLRRDNDTPSLDGRLKRLPQTASLRLCMMRMCLTDGIGHGLWRTRDVSALRCPVDAGVMRLLRVFYPICMLHEEDVDEILAYLGFDRPCEFMYAYWACQSARVDFEFLGKKLKLAVSGGIMQDTWRDKYRYGKNLLNEVK